MQSLRKHSLTLLLSLTAAFSALAQQADDSKVKLLSAQSAQLIDKDGESYRKVVGPARFFHNNTYLLCDTALWNVNTNIIDAIGHVRIIQDQTQLSSETLQYVVDEKGAHGFGDGTPESVMEWMPDIVVLFMKLTAKKPKAEGEIHEQYATAIPIGTAIAQSWNEALAESLGDLVGDEMERFGVHLWLAPALNIHRDIRCGRNFEYFSEDPLISGKFAAAITRGVQKHPGCGTTIKHYAANNQETNRYTSNSQMSERALREIYLRGFGICVRESQPHALMTSYNLLNGTHTSERRGILERVLRREFGYQGIVMTDWVLAAMNSKGNKHGYPNPALVAGAGNDLFMPGGKKEWQRILKGLKGRKLSRKQLDINATRVYRMAKKLVK